MPYVARIRNRVTGSVQIDSTRPSLALLAKGDVVSAAQGGIYGNVATFDVAAAGTPLFAIRSSVFAAIAHVTSPSSGVYRVHIYTPSAGQTVTVYAFGAPSYQGPGYALVVRNPDTNAVTFDSRMKYARRGGLVAGNYLSGPLVHTLAAGKTYAAMPLRKAGWNQTWGVHIPAGGGDPSYEHYQLHGERFYSGLRFNSGSEVQLTPGVRAFNGFLGLISTVGYPTLRYEQPEFMWLMLDVTGY